jgi:hypothetical protein
MLWPPTRLRHSLLAILERAAESAAPRIPRQNRSLEPWEGAVCRPLKVGKEEIMGMLAALDHWSQADLGALNKEWQSRVERVQKLVETSPGVTTSIAVPQDENSYPTLTVTWDEKKFGLTVAECDQQLRTGEPRIEVLTNSNPSGVFGRIRNNDPNRQRSDRRITCRLSP